MDRRKALKTTGMMAGASLLMPSLLSLLQSCKQESRLDWQPVFFDESEANLISTLVDTILPRTDTPGALDVKVDMFLDKVAANIYDDAGQQQLKIGIAQFNADSEKDFGKEFVDLSEDDRKKMLQKAEKTSGKYNPDVWGTAVGKQEPIGFYRSLKSMALWAYFSSEEIGKNVTVYDPIPGAYKGCIPLADVGNKWTL
ncbi:MAG: gluconate 2-dehydrogenase subunit 3 family protein [Pricia sp.]|nr:gluconate 2-dehydrogenase subunit 3 family protein [Pricia sp.]